MLKSLTYYLCDLLFVTYYLETPVIIFYGRRSALLLSACQLFIRLVKFP